jgi:uncharacterized protein YceH (UPF0502 family)
MNLKLSTLEARVIGSLIEKQISTPDQYPLSINALVNACNQKSNREPVLELDERTVQNTVDVLARRHLVVERSGFGSRVPKYQHRFCNTEYGTLKFSERELAVLCELLLRGAQMPGELRSRAGRLAPFRDVVELEDTLGQLMSREDGPFVVKLPREPGRRESRYMHLFSGEVTVPADSEDSVALPVSGAVGTETAAAEAGLSTPRSAALESRLDHLEAMLLRLAADVEELKRHGGGAGVQTGSDAVS